MPSERVSQLQPLGGNIQLLSGQFLQILFHVPPPPSDDLSADPDGPGKQARAPRRHRGHTPDGALTDVQNAGEVLCRQKRAHHDEATVDLLVIVVVFTPASSWSARTSH
jgi:hypothetical protein